MSRPISELPAFVNGFVADIRDVLFDTAKHVKDRMAEPATPITYPVNWDGEIDPIKHTTKQQRAYFASNGFDAGIPYHRKNTFELAWQAERVDFGATLKNLHPAAGAIGGTPSGWQSRIQRGRRNNLLVVLFEELAKIPAAISNKFTVRSRD